MAPALNVANYLIFLRDRDLENGEYHSLTNLKLQKLLYYCQGAHYKWDEKKLIEDALFEAWDYGPVIREVYYKFKNFGQNDIHVDDYKTSLPEDEKDTIEAVWNQLKGISAFDLVKHTHSEAPWLEARKKQNIFISDAALREYFSNPEEVSS